MLSEPVSYPERPHFSALQSAVEILLGLDLAPRNS